MTLEHVVILSIALVTAAVVVWPASVICRRTGHSPWLAILAIIPLANVGLLWFIALSRWSSTQRM